MSYFRKTATYNKFQTNLMMVVLVVLALGAGYLVRSVQLKLDPPELTFTYYYQCANFSQDDW